MYNWVQIAHLIEVNYGGHVDWVERFFICPECGEPVYVDDWESEDDFLDDHNNFICPICESVIE